RVAHLHVPPVRLQRRLDDVAHSAPGTGGAGAAEDGPLRGEAGRLRGQRQAGGRDRDDRQPDAEPPPDSHLTSPHDEDSHLAAKVASLVMIRPGFPTCIVICPLTIAGVTASKRMTPLILTSPVHSIFVSQTVVVRVTIVRLHVLSFSGSPKRSFSSLSLVRHWRSVVTLRLPLNCSFLLASARPP